MYVRIPIIIKKAAEHTNNPVFHSEDYVLACIESLGWTMPNRLGSDGHRETTYTTECIDPGTTVNVQSLTHYRDLATKNGKKVFGESALKEIEKYGIYFGTIPAMEANVYIARTSYESLSVFVTQRDISKLHACTKNVIEKLMALPITDASTMVGQRATVYSSKENSEVGHGNIQQRSLKHLYRSSRIEYAIFLLAFVLLITSASLTLLPDTLGQVDVAKLKSASSEVWKAALGALVGALCALTATYLTMDRSFIDFSSR